MTTTNLDSFALKSAAIPDDGVWKRASNIGGTYYKSVLWYRYLWNNTYIQLRGTLDCSTGGAGPGHDVCQINEAVLPESSQWWVAATNGNGYVQVGLKSTGVVAVAGNAANLAPTAVYIPGILVPVLGNGKSAGGPRSAMDIPDEADEDVEIPDIPKEFTRPAPVEDLGERIDQLEVRIDSMASGGGTVDTSGLAKLNDETQTIVADVLAARRFRFDQDKSLILLISGGQDRPVYRNGTKSNLLAFSSELAGYCTIADAATQIGLCAKKADTYTKDEVETRLLEVPSGMRYLQWGGVMTKQTAANAKDKWFAAGLIPAIQIVKGKHYRLDMTVRFGPINTDVKVAWVGFRFRNPTLNELPCTKHPLVTMSGFGTTSVTSKRTEIAASPIATATATRADRFRLCYSDDWNSAEEIIEYSVEFEADQDIASCQLTPEITFGGQWGLFPTEYQGLVAVFRQMD